MLHFAVLFAVLAFASAQEYSCAPGYCHGQGFDRVNEAGCDYFCYMDTLPPTGLTCEEFHITYGKWKGSAAECDLQCFLTANRVIVPRACDSELEATYNILAYFDGNQDTISGSDIESWCQFVFAIQIAGGGDSEIITPGTFQAFWERLFAAVGDPTCDKV